MSKTGQIRVKTYPQIDNKSSPENGIIRVTLKGS
jgi:hypothetical protein